MTTSPGAADDPAPDPTSGPAPRSGTTGGHAPRGPVPTAGGVSLATLMLVIALMGVCLALLAQAPLLGGGLSVMAAIALIRTAWTFRRSRRQGRPMSRSQQVATFLRTFAATAALLLSGPIAFLAVCFPLGAAAMNAKDAAAEQRAWVSGLVAGVAATQLVALILWFPRGPRHDPHR